MAIDSVAAVASTTAFTPATTSTTAANQTMDSDMFMKLLVTQLTNQDPSSPMDSNQMITQTTQLATMEKLTSLSDTSTESFSLQMRNAAAELMGKNVSYVAKDGTTATGTATSVSYVSGVPQVTIGGVVVALDSVSGVTSAATSTESTADASAV
jgi:flagellar basal-body rod modification protein FlgD